MDICLTASQMLEAMLPDQKPDPAKTYRPSIYNHIKTCGDRTYVYNVLTRRLARLTPEEALLLQGNVTGDAPPELIAKRFLVPVDTDEAAHYVQLYSTQELFLSTTDKGYTMYDILPTTGCNARCFYCFEQGVQVKHMTQDTADAVVDFIKKTHAPGEKIELSWFGGEPMLCPGIIDRICAAVRAAGIEYHSTMITNGSLFTPELVEKAKKDWLLSKVQVTLDGAGEEHERRKAYVALPDSFRITVENIHRLVDAGMGVVVRMNMDPGNAQSIRQLYQMLRTQFRPTDKVAFDPAILSESWFLWSADRTAEQQEVLRQDWLQLRSQIVEDGFYRAKKLHQQLPRWHCMANSPLSVTVLPDGTLSMCQTGCDAMYYGDVRRGITKPEIVKAWRDCTNIRDKCRNCPYLPECTGFAMCPSQQSDCRRGMEDVFRLRLEKTIREYEDS